MNCIDAAEYISALCDRETIPADAARHIAVCAACTQALNEYMVLGAALRQAASIELAEEPLRALLPDQENKIAHWWRKGGEQMRIPRVVFAMLVLCLVLVGTRLAVVEVGAHSTGNAVKIAVDFGPGLALQPCYLQNGKRDAQDCSTGAGSQDGRKFYSYSIFLKQFDGARFLLELRALALHADENGKINHLPIMSQPAREVWLTPGQPLDVPLADGEKLKLNGEWIDRVPSFMAQATHTNLDPKPNELRLSNPMLVRDGSIAGDLEGFSCRSNGPNSTAQLYYPKVGRFTFALEQFPGSIEASVKGSRVRFSIEGKQYTLFNGTPMASADKIWVLREEKSASNDHGDWNPIGCGDLRKIGQVAQK